jgi:hypothetical protein
MHMSSLNVQSSSEYSSSVDAVVGPEIRLLLLMHDVIYLLNSCYTIILTIYIVSQAATNNKMH